MLTRKDLNDIDSWINFLHEIMSARACCPYPPSPSMTSEVLHNYISFQRLIWLRAIILVCSHTAVAVFFFFFLFLVSIWVYENKPEFSSSLSSCGVKTLNCGTAMCAVHPGGNYLRVLVVFSSPATAWQQYRWVISKLPKTHPMFH